MVGQKENAKAKLVGSLWLTLKRDRDFPLPTSLLKFTETLSLFSSISLNILFCVHFRKKLLFFDQNITFASVVCLLKIVLVAV